MAEGHLDHIVHAGLLGPEFLGRLSPEEEQRREARAEARRRLAPREPEPEDEIAPPEPLELLPGADAIAAMVTPWVADPDQAPAAIVHEARVLHHYARAALMTELPDLPDDPPSTEEPDHHHEEIDDADP